MTYVSEDGDKFVAPLPGRFGLHCTTVEDNNGCGDFAMCVHKALNIIRIKHCEQKKLEAINTGTKDSEAFFHGMCERYSSQTAPGEVTTSNCIHEIIRVQKAMMSLDESITKLSEFFFVEPMFDRLYNDSIVIRQDLLNMRQDMYKLIEKHNNMFSIDQTIGCDCSVPTNFTYVKRP